jgi:hypothetical protein
MRTAPFCPSRGGDFRASTRSLVLAGVTRIRTGWAFRKRGGSEGASKPAASSERASERASQPASERTNERTNDEYFGPSASARRRAVHSPGALVMDQIRERLEFLTTDTHVGCLSAAASHAPSVIAQAVVFELVFGAVEVERSARSDGMLCGPLARTAYAETNSDQSASQDRKPRCVSLRARASGR